jgi:hypothetical protein
MFAEKWQKLKNRHHDIDPSLKQPEISESKLTRTLDQGFSMVRIRERYIASLVNS